MYTSREDGDVHDDGTIQETVPLEVGIGGWMSRDGRVSNEREIRAGKQKAGTVSGTPSATALKDAYAVGWC